MERRLILRGVLAGALGGLLAFLFARVFAEPQIQRAIDYETARDAAQQALDKAAGLPVQGAEAEVFSRSLQANVGAGLGLILFGAAVGALFAVAYAVCLGRAGRVPPRALAVLVAGGGFLALYLVPFLKYPADPPGIGHADTIRLRGTGYLIMVVSSVLLLVLCTWLGRRLQPRYGAWTATLLAAGTFLLATGVLMALLPPVRGLAANGLLVDPGGRIVFPGFPADVLYRFRLYSVGAQLVLWAVIAVTFGPLAERLLRPPAPTAPTAVDAVA
jgi:Probable cobalt transporter subunit (CbtA)